MSMSQEQQKTDLTAIMNAAAAPIAGVEMREFNPLENIPSLSVGSDIKEGMTISGVYLGTERIISHKFKSSTRDQLTGKPVQLLHKLRISDGSTVGIWSTGELRVVFERVKVNTVVALTYNGKGKNAKGDDQHFFEYQIGELPN